MFFLFFFLLIFNLSCSGDSARQSAPDPEATIAPAQEKESRSSREKPLAWEDSFKEMFREPYEKKEDGSFLSLKLQNKEPFAAQGFDSFVIELGVRLAEAKAPFTAVFLEAVGNEQSIFKARFYLSDVLEYKKGEISQPELLRRFEVEVVETVDSLKAKIKEARKEGLNEDAREALVKWTGLEPYSIPAWSLLGNVTRDLKKYFEAISAYKKVLEMEPNSPFALRNLAVCAEKIGTFDDSIKWYKQALEGDAQNVLLMQQLADVYRKNGDANAAMVWIGRARAIKDSADLWMVEGNINRHVKKYAKAREAYLKAQKMNPADTRILFNLLLIDLDTKNFTEAKKKYADLKLKDPRLAEELGGVYVFQESNE
ncbi:MAG: tetratricopeptide repeat protein [Deltaproteobacteria bacterium]|nr:tetratricopeptide repeat protein [Deltaproteobacteria bacterium]